MTTATDGGLDVTALVRELVGRTTISGDAVAQRDALGALTEVLRERAPHLQVTEGRDPDHLARVQEEARAVVTAALGG